MESVHAPEIDLQTIDQRVYLRLAWADLERLLEARGESSATRITYLDGVLELMSPSRDHEYVKTNIARLLEAWALELDEDLEGYGSWTVKSKKSKSALEPDECYTIGPAGEKRRPDLAIEVTWTSGGLEKLEVYRRLQVPEVWVWAAGEIQVYGLRAKGYSRLKRSALLPRLDIELLARFAAEPQQTKAVKSFIAAIRSN
jgi:Uma2 family endonuclease